MTSPDYGVNCPGSWFATWCQIETFTGAFSVSYTMPSPQSINLPGTTGSATLTISSLELSATVHFALQFLVCSGLSNSCFPLRITPYYVGFSESYSEDVVASLAAGASGFEVTNFNSQPWDVPGLGGTLAFYTFYGIVSLSVDLNLGLEYDIGLGASDSITLNQGSYGSADQNYSFNASSWTNTNTPTSCYSAGQLLSDGCLILTPSNPFYGYAALRAGPVLSVTLSVIGGEIAGYQINLGSVTGWAFLFAGLSLYVGQGTTPSPSGDWSGGECSSGYAVDGLWNTPPYYQLESQLWLVGCWQIGVQFGASWSAILGLFSGSIATSPAYNFATGPVVTTLDVCDVQQVICTQALTGVNPTNPDPAWVMGSGQSNTLDLFSPLTVAGYDYSIGGTWTTPVPYTAGSPNPCGSITVVPSGPTGSTATYQAPTIPAHTTAYCELTFNTGLFLGLSIPSDQINSVSFVVQINGPSSPIVVPICVACVLHPCLYLPIICSLEAAGFFWAIQLKGNSSNATTLNASEILGQPIVLKNLTNGTYTYRISPPAGLTVRNGTNGTVSVAGAQVYLPIEWEALNVTFKETGLPSGTGWAVEVDGATMDSSTSAVGFTAASGNLTYRVNHVAGYYVTPTNTSTISVGSSDLTVPITFVKNATSTPKGPETSLVQFNASGLPKGEPWTVALAPGIAVTGTSPSFELANGTYRYTILPLSGYVPQVGGSFVVHAPGPIYIDRTFAVRTYGVFVEELGLPNGTNWSVTVDGSKMSSTGHLIAMPVPNGTYNYTIHAVPNFVVNSTGTVEVNGSFVTVTAYFQPVLYPVALREQGLPLDTPFSGEVAGSPLSLAVSGIASSLVWLEPNGSYSYEFTSPPGWTADAASSGTIVVKGGNSTVELAFVPSAKPYFEVTFKETGLPANHAAWPVTLDGMTLLTDTKELNFSLPDGTYSFSIGSIPGFTPRTTSGTLTVHNKHKTITVKFTATLYAVTFKETGLPKGSWSVKIGGHSKKAPVGDTVVFDLADGNYSYAIGSVKGYNSSGAPAYVTVSGNGTSVLVTFTTSGELPHAGYGSDPVSAAVGASSPPRREAPTFPVWVVAGLVAAAWAAIGLALLRHRRAAERKAERGIEQRPT